LPTNLIAGFLGFDEKLYFQAANGSEVAPQVNLELNK